MEYLLLGIVFFVTRPKITPDGHLTNVVDVLVVVIGRKQ